MNYIKGENKKKSPYFYGNLNGFKYFTIIQWNKK